MCSSTIELKWNSDHKMFFLWQYSLHFTVYKWSTPGKAKTAIPGSAHYQQRCRFVVSMARQILLLIQQKSSLPHMFFCSYYLSPWMPPGLLEERCKPTSVPRKCQACRPKGLAPGSTSSSSWAIGRSPSQSARASFTKKWFKWDTSG